MKTILTILLSTYSFFTVAQLPQRLRDLKIDIQRHLFENLKYPYKAERTYKQGKTVAYFKVVNKQVTLLAVAPKLDINFKNEIIKAFKGYQTNDLKDGRYGIPIHFGIHNVLTKLINSEVEVHSSYIDLPYVEIFIGSGSCDPGAPHFYCDDDALHNWTHMTNKPVYPEDDFRGFMNFIKKNTKYPKAAYKNQIQGDVYVSFVIEKDGSLNEAKVVRSLGYGTDEEALRVLNLSPKWTPGFENGKPVRTQYYISVKFYPEKPFKNPKTNDILLSYQLKYPPVYSEGEQRLKEIIQTNINYKALHKRDIEGSIIIHAVVEKDGSLSDLETKNNLGFGTKKEAIRVIGNLKKWTPGLFNGKPIRAKIAIPVQFNP